MKKISIFIGLLFNIIFTIAQTTNYYTISQPLKGPEYTYQCDVLKGGEVRLYNSKNRWTYTDQMKIGTNVPFYVTPENYEPLMVEDEREAYNDSIYKVNVNDAFGNYRGKMKSYELFIITCISSETGEISELYFDFSNRTPYATVPISVYREIETKLVGLKYTLTPLAKTLNYVYQWWAIEPKQDQ